MANKQWRTTWTYVLHGEVCRGGKTWPADYTKDDAIEATWMRMQDSDYTESEWAQIRDTLQVKAVPVDKE